MDWLDILKNQQKNKNDKLEAVGYIRDILDYGDISKNNAKKISIIWLSKLRYRMMMTQRN